MIAKVKKNPADPLGVLVAGIVQILAAAGIFSKLDMNADQIAQVGSGLLMIAATIRFMMTKQAEPAAPAVPAAEAPSTDEEEAEEPETPSDSSEGTDEPAEPTEDDKTPVVGPPPSTTD